MPVTNARQTAEWQARFNQVVRSVLEPVLGSRGYQVSLDQVTEEVEPDSYGPFYVGEVGFSRELPDGDHTHIIVQSTTQLGTTAHLFYVDLRRNRRPTPPHFQDPTSPGAGAQARVSDPRVGGSARGQQGWAFADAAELRSGLDRLADRLTAATAAAGPALLAAWENGPATVDTS